MVALDTETGELTDLVFDGHPGPSEGITATALDDGRIAAITRGGSIVAIDPSRTDARWELVSEMKTADAIRSEPSVAYDATTKKFFVPGSWTPLAVIMAIFFVKYAYAVMAAMKIGVVSAPLFVVVMSAVYGLLSGYFAARAFNLLKRAGVV